MTVKDQFNKLKENWLMIVLGLVVLVFISGGSNVLDDGFYAVKSGGYDMMNYGGGYYESEAAYASGYANTRIYDDSGFAPEVEERKVTKTSSMSSESERGEFREDEERLKNIISSSGAYLLNERVNRNGEGWRGYYSGYYNLKVDTDKYDSVVAQLKEIAEVQDFNENALDVTGSYEDLSVELEVEKTRLSRYLQMYEEAVEIGDKIELNDRIFDQERRIKYIENSLRNVDNRVDYSTISFSLTEERSEWTSIAFVRLSELVRGFVDSLNGLIMLIAKGLVWVLFGWLVWLGWKRVKG